MYHTWSLRKLYMYLLLVDVRSQALRVIYSSRQKEIPKHGSATSSIHRLFPNAGLFNNKGLHDVQLRSVTGKKAETSSLDQYLHVGK